MSDCFNAITLAVWVYVLIPFWMVWGYYWIKDKQVQRRERQRIDDADRQGEGRARQDERHLQPRPKVTPHQ